MLQVDSHVRFRRAKKSALWWSRGGFALGSGSGRLRWKTAEDIATAGVGATLTRAILGAAAVAVTTAEAGDAITVLRRRVSARRRGSTSSRRGRRCRRW